MTRSVEHADDGSGSDDGHLADGGHRVAAVVVAAGSGARLGADVPKALVRVAGRPLVAHAVRGLTESGVGAVVVVAPAERLEEVRASLAEAVSDGEVVGDPAVVSAARSGAEPGVHAEEKLSARGDVRPWVRVVAGGESRQASVAAGLAALAELPETAVVLVHDAARCFAPPAMIRRVIDAVRAGHGAVIPALPVADSLVIAPGDAVEDYVDRARLRIVQTPQGFSRDVLVRAHAAAPPAHESTAATDDAQLAAAVGETVWTVPGDDAAMKITTPRDLAVARALFGAR
ncbi:MAG: 2-C-methyl-D-erythritol 4-phosphate cytidylyltransferase [Actinomycetales bacterium]|nr:2-C-methyl-D-erythritol 4-phosphate cytidylyltransferase [Actinomycetales bacterium]